MTWVQDTNGKWWWQGNGYTEGPYEDPNFSRPLPSIGHWSQNSDGSWWSTERPGEHYVSPGGARHVPAPTLPPAQQVPGGTTPTNDTAKDGEALFKATLGQFGLEALSTWAWQRFQETGNFDQVMLELRQRDEYKARFPGMDALSQKGRAISEGEYIDLEKAYVSLYRRAGLPVGFYDTPDDFAGLISGEVSPAELGERLDMYADLVYRADPAGKQFLKDYYGVDEGGILAFTIDPTKAVPILEKQFRAAESSAAAVRAGFGALTKGEAEQIANWNIDPQQAADRFTQLGLNRELFGQLPGERSFNVDRETAIAGFLGGNAQAIEQIERKRGQRKGQFEGGGGFATTNQGVVGIAASQR